MKFNAEGLRQALLSQKDKGKAIVLLNFPNNPTGYTPGAQEAAIVSAIQEAAEAGMNIVVVTDDAYFGLFFEDSLKESLFGLAGPPRGHSAFAAMAFKTHPLHR